MKPKDHLENKPNMRAKSVYEYIKTWDEEKIKKSVSYKFPDFELDKIELQPSTICQLRCPWCYGKNIRSRDYNAVPFEIYKKNVLDCLINKPVIMLGGLYSEPLLYPDIKKLIKSIGEHELRFALITNGIALDNELIDIIAEASLKNKTDRPSHISLDISGLLYANLLDEVLPKIEKLSRTFHLLHINTPVLLTKNLLDTDKIKALQKKLFDIGATNIRYSIPQTPIDPAYKKAFEIMNKMKGKNIFRGLSEKPYSHCFIMTNSLTIAPNGDVYPCSQTATDCFNHLRIGSITKQKITDIWHSKRHKEIFKKLNPQNEICRCNTTEMRFNSLCEKYYDSRLSTKHNETRD